jgi:iron complex outermembrane receptor protein
MLLVVFLSRFYDNGNGSSLILKITLLLKEFHPFKPSNLSRTDISIADKYALTLSYRRDGTSRFTEDNRWADFRLLPCMKLNEENFLKDASSSFYFET